MFSLITKTPARFKNVYKAPAKINGIGMGMNLIGEKIHLPDNLNAPNPINPEIAAEAPTAIISPTMKLKREMDKFGKIPLKK